MNHVEPGEVGIERNILSGEMSLQTAGWHFTSPFSRVARIDIRPMRVSITTSGHGYSSKLVRFNTDEWELFVKTEGFRYYWWDNRLSFNSGYAEEYRGLRDIIRGYAYSDIIPPFIIVENSYSKGE